MAYNESLRKYQNIQREKTVLLVQEAIDFIKSDEGEGAAITPKKLMDITRALSEDGRSISKTVLFKPHILKVWNPVLWEQKFNSSESKPVTPTISKLREVRKLEEENMKMTAQIQTLQSAVQRLERKLDIEQKEKEVLRFRNEELEEEVQKLLGRLHDIQSKLDARGLAF